MMSLINLIGYIIKCRIIIFQIIWCLNTFRTIAKFDIGLMGDIRLDAQAQALRQRFSKPVSVISWLSTNRAAQVVYYWLLENEKLGEYLIEELTATIVLLDSTITKIEFYPFWKIN